MSEADEKLTGVAGGPVWTPWGQPRRGERGVETAFHHPLVLVRAPGAGNPRVVAPGEIFAGAGAELEWSPMSWAQRGRRQWRGPRKPEPGAVFRAGDRLMLSSDYVCEQLFEGEGLGARGLKGWVDALKRRCDHFDAGGVLYRWLVVPEGHAIHADAIDGAPKLSPDRPLMRILRAADDRARARLVYPLDALIAGRARAETSHPHDVHLTGYGNFLCYRALMRSLPNVDPARVIDEDELSSRKVFVAGDVARGVGAQGRRVDFHEAPRPRHASLIKGNTYRADQVDVFETEHRDLPRLVMFRTSNSTHLFPYLMRHFSRIVAMATTSVFYDLVASERPDVVVSEMPERYFAPADVSPSETDRTGTPPDDGTDPFERRSGFALPLPRGEAAI